MLLNGEIYLAKVVGPAGLGLGWRRMSVLFNNNSAIMTVSLVILGFTIFEMANLLLLISIKSLMYPHIAKHEFTHPIHHIFINIVPLYFCLSSPFIYHFSTIVAEVFWYIGFGGMLLTMIFSAWQYLNQKVPLASISAFHLLGPLPMLLAVQLAPFAHPDLLFCGWSIAIIWYMGLHTVLIIRWKHVGFPSSAQRGAMWLLIAASSDAVLGYAAARGFGDVSKLIFFFSLLQFVVLLLSSKRLFATGFLPTWWMTTLPAAAFSSSWMAYGASIGSMGIQYFGVALIGLTTVWIGYLYVMTAITIFRQKLLPPSAFKAAPEKDPIT